MKLSYMGLPITNKNCSDKNKLDLSEQENIRREIN
jgi:hypothetical protein